MKCYCCRKKVKKGKLFCKKCEDREDRAKGSGTYVIYDKI